MNFNELWCKFGVKLAADKMFSIRVADDSEKVNSQTSRGKPGIPARKYKTKQKRNTRQKMRKIHIYNSHMSRGNQETILDGNAFHCVQQTW